MSPILKRDVHEQLRQAKRLAQSITGLPSHLDSEYDFERGHGDSYTSSSPGAGPSGSNTAGIGIIRGSVEIYTSSSHPRRGIGVRDVEVQNEGGWRKGTVSTRMDQEDEDRNEDERREEDRGEWEYPPDEEDGEGGKEEQRLFLPPQNQSTTVASHTSYPPRTPNLPLVVSPHPGLNGSSHLSKDEATGPTTPLSDLRSLLFEVSIPDHHWMLLIYRQPLPYSSHS